MTPTKTSATTSPNSSWKTPILFSNTIRRFVYFESFCCVSLSSFAVTVFFNWVIKRTQLRMGCCVSKKAKLKANQVSRWRSTGIVALRDAKLKASNHFNLLIFGQFFFFVCTCYIYLFFFLICVCYAQSVCPLNNFIKSWQFLVWCVGHVEFLVLEMNEN